MDVLNLIAIYTNLFLLDKTMKVVHCKRQKYTVYIGRPSIFGNPYTIGKDGTREEVIEKYEQYARTNENLAIAIYKLKESDILGCWCSPEKCHGDIIIKIWKEIHE